jgi:hypothetical protein
VESVELSASSVVISDNHFKGYICQVARAVAVIEIVIEIFARAEIPAFDENTFLRFIEMQQSV